MGKRGNKSVRTELIKMYGKKCMFLSADIEDKIKGTKIKGFRKYITEKKYSGKAVKKKMKRLTLHHLKHRSEGGDTTLNNGAVISEIAHEYIHSLPREDEEVINNMLRDYKECKVVLVDNLDLGFKVCPTIIEFKERDKNYERD